jgi:uncharacterized protein (DUF2235 family)
MVSFRPETSVTTQSRTYVVCIDGTGNHPNQIDPAVQTPEPATSNVFRMFKMLTGKAPDSDGAINTLFGRVAPNGPSVDAGRVLYRYGVGSVNRWPIQVWEQYSGQGTLERIRSAYSFLAAHASETDRIFAFGFSRGAFAVRSLAGLLQHVGLPDPPDVLPSSLLDTVMAAYENRVPGLPANLPNFRPAHVDFLGLWDTVGALRFSRTLHDISPSNVKRVAHALALDELRPEFAPELWGEPAGSTKVAEAWFTGAHSNIGGGYGQDELSNIALSWVIAEAADALLPLPGEYSKHWLTEHVLGATRSSHAEFLARLGSVGKWLKGPPTPRSLAPVHSVHRSVLDRMAGNVDSPYNTTKHSGDGSDFTGWQGYAPRATLAGGGSFAINVPGQSVVETEDYLGPPPPQA